MDTVFIEGLSIDTLVGVHDWERKARRSVTLDLEMAFDCAAAGASDALEDALDYAAVAARVTEVVQSARFQLIEALAEAVASAVRKDFPVAWLRLTIHKTGALGNAANVGVTIERGERR